MQLGVVRIEFDRRVPFVGASSRAALREIRLGADLLASRPRRSLFELIGGPNGVSFWLVPGVSINMLTQRIPESVPLFGARLDILYSGTGLSFSDSTGIK
jgi:hypothetical protein